MKVIKMGTRGSALAQAQAKWVASQIEAAHYGVHVELVTLTTAGDRRREDDRIPPGGLKNLFTKEIEEALLARRIDLAVHSLKDMGTQPPAGLRLGALPKREDPRDAWISKTKTPFKDVRAGARIGTSAIRRHSQIKLRRPELEPVPLRGNVDTRMSKLHDPEEALDGIVLAAAGLKRLGRESDITDILPVEVMLPAPGQGCLAVQARDQDSSMDVYLQAIDHAPTRVAITAERAFLAGLGGSCRTPIAALATIDGDTVEFTGIVVAEDGRVQMRDKRRGPTRDAEELGRAAANHLLSCGASQLLG